MEAHDSHDDPDNHVSPLIFVIGIDEYRPAGTYTVETDEELIEGLTFSAYRRTSARICLPPTPLRPGITETVAIDPVEIDAALKEQPR